MKKAFLLFTILLAVALSLPAQTPAPATHFVLSGSATGFAGPGGTYAAVIAGAAIQITDHISAGYNQLTVPTLGMRWELGVVNYTRPLTDILPQSFLAKLKFDPSNIYLTGQAGIGKLLEPSANHIAETLGLFVSYPLSNNVSLQLVGLSGYNGGVQRGIVTTNQQIGVSTGINFSF